MEKSDIYNGAGAAFEQGIAKIGTFIAGVLIFRLLFLLMLAAFAAAFHLVRISKGRKCGLYRQGQYNECKYAGEKFHRGEDIFFPSFGQVVSGV